MLSHVLYFGFIFHWLDLGLFPLLLFLFLTDSATMVSLWSLLSLPASFVRYPVFLFNRVFILMMCFFLFRLIFLPPAVTTKFALFTQNFCFISFLSISCVKEFRLFYSQLAALNKLERERERDMELDNIFSNQICHISRTNKQDVATLRVS